MLCEETSQVQTEFEKREKQIMHSDLLMSKTTFF